LLRNLPDLVLDTPEAPTILGNFIARSVADDTLAPRFLHNYQGKVECELAK
jgi:programmed cell death protein 4